MKNIKVSLDADTTIPQKGKKKKNKIKTDKKNKKKDKSSNKKGVFRKKLKLFVLLLILILCGVGGYMAYTRWDRLQTFNESKISSNPGEDVQVCNNIFDPSCWSKAFSPQLEQYNGITGALIVGLDTRDEGAAQSGLMNTDSIMVALYNHETKKTSLISLPRDLYVPYHIGDNGPFYTKINAIYATGEQRSDVEDGFDLLEQTVEEIIGQQIQYRVVIKLEGVKDGVDAVGGVEIDVPTYLKVQYPNDYPGQDGKPYDRWLYYEFQPGKQQMDGEHALVWSRFRKVVKGDMSYASDFSRADRQQQVLDALKTKALAEDGSALDKAKKYWNIFQSINKNVEADIGLEEMFAGFSLTDEADLNPVNIVMDPNFGGLNQIIYHPPTTETGGYIIKFKDQTFETAHQYLDLIWKYPKLYDEDAKILVENQTGTYYNNEDTAIKFRDAVKGNDLPITINNLTMITESESDAEGVIIVDMTKGEKTGTTKYLAEYFKASKIVEDPENYGYEQSGYDEDIKIIITPAPQSQLDDTGTE